VRRLRLTRAVEPLKKKIITSNPEAVTPYGTLAHVKQW
jgi:hypothetical protein